MKTIFSPTALEHLKEWIQTDARVASKIIDLVEDIAKTPFTGKGKPEPLKHNLKGKWSRRITQEHRLVYEIKEDAIQIISCKYHYDS